MKKLFSIITLLCLLVFPSYSLAAYGYGAAALTGGTSGCLDAINGASISDGDKAFVVTSTAMYVYDLDATSGASESSPTIISPDSNAGTKRWKLVYIVTNSQGIDTGRYGTDAQVSDTYVITLSPVPADYYTGMVLYFYAATANTGAASLNVNALGAVDIKKNTGDDLQTGDIEAGQVVGVIHDGTSFQLLTPPATVFGAYNFTAGDTVYATAASTLAKLAIGTANYKMFTNAGATAPEWAAGIKIGTFDRAMDADTGDVAYTSVGFKPTLLIFFGGVTGTSIVSLLGNSNGTNHYGIYDNHGVSADTLGVDATAAINLYEAAGKSQTAIVKTLGADGFTLTWTRTGATAAGTATIFYIALR